MRNGLIVTCVTAAVSLLAACSETPELRTGARAGVGEGKLEAVVLLYGPMPTGVTVSHGGRIFLNFPRWEDSPAYTVGELKDGQVVPFPNAEINRLDKSRARETLVSVQSVVVDPTDRLWILDAGSINFQPAVSGGPKLLCVDLKQNRVTRTISFPSDVVPPASYLNDVRFDLRRGKAGMAFITDSGEKGPGGIVVVDLDTGESWRRLGNHHSVQPDEAFAPFVEGEYLMVRPPVGEAKPLQTKTDGIAISADGEELFYCPLASHKLYRVSVYSLIDRSLSDDQVSAMARPAGVRDFASDGLESDASNRLYLTDYEHNAIQTWNTGDGFSVLITDPRLIWPDTMAIATDGYLYVTANQLNRMARFHRGLDKRKQPYGLFRIRVDAGPVMQKGQALGEATR